MPPDEVVDWERDPFQQPATSPGRSTSSSWRSGTSAPRMPIWAPANSTRSSHHRSYTFTRSVKHKWLVGAVMDRCRSASEPSLGESQHSFKTSLRSIPNRDVFSTTNEFYREAVKKLSANE